MKHLTGFLLLAILSMGNVIAADVPWGSATVTETQYKP